MVMTNFITAAEQAMENGDVDSAVNIFKEMLHNKQLKVFLKNTGKINQYI